MDTGSRLSIAAIIILLGLAMYFAIAETSFATVSRIRLKTRLDKGDHRAKKALLVLDNFDKAITTILIGTNIVHITVAGHRDGARDAEMGHFGGHCGHPCHDGRGLFRRRNAAEVGREEV